MGRLIGAVLLGYIAMSLAVFAALTLAYVALGADRSFLPGTYDVSTLWIAVSFTVGILAALLGGWVARRIARSVTGPRILAGLVLVLGIVMTLMASGGPDVAVTRPEGVGAMEAMQAARTPFWIMLLNPLIGAIGVLIGGRALRGREAPVSAGGLASPS